MRRLLNLILVLALLLSACASGSEAGSTETPAPSQEIRTTEAEETPAETADSTLPKVSIDPESKTLSVSGTEKYTALVIPAEAASLYTLKEIGRVFSRGGNQLCGPVHEKIKGI